MDAVFAATLVQTSAVRVRTVLLSVGAMAAALACAAVLVLRSCSEALFYRNRVARLEKLLEERNAVAGIQAWLAEPGSRRVLTRGIEAKAAEWPAVIQDLHPSFVRESGDGGASVVWYQGMP
jgi:hypothetical protein